MGERVSRINDTKVELGRCTDDELYSMAGYITERVSQAERELQAIKEELESRLEGFDAPLELVAD